MGTKCNECGNVDHFVRCELCSQLIDLSAEAKVIEAAKAFCESEHAADGTRTETLVHEAVEALLAAEGEADD